MDENIEIYGVRLNNNIKSIDGFISYTDQCENLEPAFKSDTKEWKTKFPFNKIKYCGFKDGKVVKYIKEYNELEYIDGTKVTEDVDIMVEIPKIYWNINRLENGNIEIKISNKKVNDDFLCPAHTILDHEVDNIYISAYEACEVLGKLRSISGKTPTTNNSIGLSRDKAQLNGPGYQQFLYYQNELLNILFLIMYKDFDCKKVLGDRLNDSTKITGKGNLKGMYYGDQSCIKFIGIENWYSNLSIWIDGLFYNNNGDILISNQNNFNNTGKDYELCGKGLSEKNEYGWVYDIQGTTKTGFLPKELKTEPEMNKYQIYCNIYKGFLPILQTNSSTNNSGFKISILAGDGYSSNSIGSRLSYIGI